MKNLARISLALLKVAFHVNGEVALELVTLAAGGALEGSVVAVQLLVLIQGSRVRERLAAYIAHVGLLTRVAAQVLPQDLGVLEPLAAHIARKRFLVRVRQFVVPQAAVESVALSADVTQVPLLRHLQKSHDPRF
jgi:hypothetical protein